MEDELIKYETAKLAKEKGFNIPVEYLFNENLATVKTYKRDQNAIKFADALHYKPIDFKSRPTQSLLQRWLREVHNIHVNIRTYYIVVNNGREYYHIVSVQHFKEEYKSYEEALEVGLLEGLKLI